MLFHFLLVGLALVLPIASQQIQDIVSHVTAIAKPGL